jgi:hypothetical protein
VEAADVETVALRAAGQGGGLPAAVLPLRRADGSARFLCAFARDEDAYAWLLVDQEGVPETARDEVRAAAEVVAMCETAEEAAAALAAEEALPLMRRAAAVAQELGDAESDLAARAVVEALEDLVAVLPAFRVAEGAYVDRIAERANLVGDRFDLLKEAAASATARLSGAPGEPLEPLAELLWDAVRLLARDGPPDRFRDAMEGAIGAAAAFAEDVEANYVLALERDGQEEEQGQ